MPITIVHIVKIAVNSHVWSVHKITMIGLLMKVVVLSQWRILKQHHVMPHILLLQIHSALAAFAELFSDNWIPQGGQNDARTCRSFVPASNDAIASTGAVATAVASNILHVVVVSTHGACACVLVALVGVARQIREVWTYLVGRKETNGVEYELNII